MEYNQKIYKRIEKYKRFHADKRPGQIMATISPYTFQISEDEKRRIGMVHQPLDSWRFPDDADVFVDNAIHNLRLFNHYTDELDSDFIPNLHVGLGIALASACFSDVEIIFGQETSWVHPVIHNWSDLEQLHPSEHHFWFQLLVQMTQRIADLCEGDYVPGSFSYFGPSDMANALRGNTLFYDYFDNPEKVHRLMGICTDAIIWLHEKLLRITERSYGGAVMADIWLPGDALFLSEDASDLCSAEIYKTFSRPYTQRILDHFGNAYIHHHALGKHIHPDIASLRNLRAVELSWDPNCPRPIDDVVNIYQMNPDVPLQTRCTAADVYKYIDELMQCKTILMVIVNNLEEAREVLDFIHQHSII